MLKGYGHRTYALLYIHNSHLPTVRIGYCHLQSSPFGFKSYMNDILSFSDRSMSHAVFLYVDIDKCTPITY
jgi:hypothetical protein